MSNPPPPDLAAALRAALSPELHHLVEPIARYVEAVAALDALVADPAIGAAVAHAIASVRGAAVPSSNGLLTFGAGSQTGDVSVRDVVGRDVITLNLGLWPFQGKGGATTIDSLQLRILRDLYDPHDSVLKREVREIAENVGLTTTELREELGLLLRERLVEAWWKQPFSVNGRNFFTYTQNRARAHIDEDGGVEEYFGLTPAARKLVRKLAGETIRREPR